MPDPRASFIGPSDSWINDKGVVPRMRAATWSDLVRDYLLSLQDNPAIQALGIMPTGGSNAAIVYHGTGAPKFTKFDKSKIGTGEGAQAYGYGHYLAGNPRTAKSYFDQQSKVIPGERPKEVIEEIRRRLTNLVGPRPTSYNWNNNQTEAQQLAMFLHDKLAFNDVNLFATKKTFDGIDSFTRPGPFRNLVKKEVANIALDLGPNPRITRTGGIVKAEIPDKAINNMLLWDEPLFNQPSKVSKFATKILEDYHLPDAARITGREFYRNYMPPNPPNFKSAIMSDAGIPGIKYLNGASRFKDYMNPTPENFNYVSFSDELPRILDYYDWSRLKELGLR